MSQDPVTPELRDRGSTANKKKLDDPIIFEKERKNRDKPNLTQEDDGNLHAGEGPKVHFADGKQQSEDDKDWKPRKTFGRVANGTIFVVPETHDMVSNLLSPNQPKNLTDFFVLFVLALHISLALYLPKPTLQTAYLCLFVFWRAGYNVGIGWLLNQQSKHGLLVYWARKYKIFEKDAHPTLYNFLEQEISAKIQNEDYEFSKAPIEYNTWLVFRKLVDLILMCDFVSYVLFALVSAEIPSHPTWMHVARWSVGAALFLFNIWVKLDAHRVVKDFAWYWGDFFFMIDQSLTFDGVYDIAPHPMYSVGYAGYYGIFLWSASYSVFYVSLLAHTAQFVFLHLVENPHIEKIYNAPAPRPKKVEIVQPLKVVTSSDESPVSQHESVSSGSWEDFIINGENTADYESMPAGRPLLGIKNFDLMRVHNLALVMITFYIGALTIATPNTFVWRSFFVSHAIIWRVIYSFGLGWVLNKQSKNKFWTRHFVKFGESPQVGWKYWQSLYFVCTYMTHISFMAASWKMMDWTELQTNWGLLKCTVGFLLILLQVWTSQSIYDSVGEFGWFYGDFFFDNYPSLTYSGIYRYLNSPERILGCASVWGFTLMTSSPVIFLCAVLAHSSTWYSIQCVERPHMQKLYGHKLRREAGLVRSIRKAVPPPVEKHITKFQGSLDTVLAATSTVFDEVVGLAKRSLTWDNTSEGNAEARIMLRDYPARLTITRLADDLANYDINYYSVTILNAKTAVGPIEGATSAFKPLSIPFGSPIRIAWTAPRNHSKADWIGLYRVADNASRSVTKIASMNRWIAVSRGEYPPYHEESLILADDLRSDPTRFEDEYLAGEATFSNDRLFWRRGVYEFRYHHAGKHNVMAISLPIEVTVDKFADERFESGRADVEEELLPLVQACYEMKEGIAPDTFDDEFGALGDAKYSKRIVYAINEMFGLDLAPEVVVADRTVRKLAWRIRRAKKVLAPFSMSVPATSAPTTPK